MWHVPNVRRLGVVPALELPYHGGISALQVLQAEKMKSAA
jgi:hypothetical protein